VIDSPEYLKLLPPEIIAAVSRQEFSARGKKEGSINGRHTSPNKGFSVEFAEHREYAKGDDLRNLDWRAYAKADRYYVKQYVEETSLRATIVLDASGSMIFRGKNAAKVNGVPASKFDYARYLAAGLAYRFIHQQDGTGLITFDHKIRNHHRAKAGPQQIHRILRELHDTKPGRDTNCARVLHEVADRIESRGLVIVIADLFDDPDKITEALHHFHFRKHELVVFHIMAEEELTFPFTKFSDFQDLENMPNQLRIDPSALKATYLENIRQFVTKIEHACGHLNADYVPVNTTTPVEDILTNWLGTRQ
jgi:uncharacterized protein (DUF58 family)